MNINWILTKEVPKLNTVPLLVLLSYCFTDIFKIRPLGILLAHLVFGFKSHGPQMNKRAKPNIEYVTFSLKTMHYTYFLKSVGRWIKKWHLGVNNFGCKISLNSSRYWHISNSKYCIWAVTSGPDAHVFRRYNYVCCILLFCLNI